MNFRECARFDLLTRAGDFGTADVTTPKLSAVTVSAAQTKGQGLSDALNDASTIHNFQRIHAAKLGAWRTARDVVRQAKPTKSGATSTTV